MRAILVKTYEVRSGKKAKARNGQLRPAQDSKVEDFLGYPVGSPQNADHADCRPCRPCSPCRLCRLSTFLLLFSFLHLLLTPILFGSGHKLMFNYISESLFMQRLR